MPKESKRASSRDKEQLSNDLQYLKIDITFDDNMDPAKSSSLSTNQEAFVQDMPNPMLFNINQKTHQGLASSQLIKNYVEHYKCLKEVSIILKEFLARMDLNSPYHGKLFPQLLTSVYRRHKFVLHGAPPRGLHEQVELEDELNADSVATAHGILGLLQLLLQRQSIRH